MISRRSPVRPSFAQRRFRRLPAFLSTDERGATAAFVAVGMVMMLSMVALAVDLGMLLGRRTESQRTADAAALAGAASFISSPNDADRPRVWAKEYAAKNMVDRTAADVRDEDVDVLVAEQKVRVRVRNISARGNAVATIFGRVLGQNEMNVSTIAAAEVVEANISVCPFPATIPDRWLDGTTGPNANNALFNLADGDKYEPYSDLADDPVIEKNQVDVCGDYAGCGVDPGVAHESYPGPAYTGFVGEGQNLGQVFELKTKDNTGTKSPDPPDPPLPGGEEAYQVSPCVDGSAWRCWFNPTGEDGFGASDLDVWVRGCPSIAESEIPEIKIEDWLEPKNGQTQSVVKETQAMVADHGGDNLKWDYGLQCVSDDGGSTCMEPSLDLTKRLRAVPLIDPTKTSLNQDLMQVIRWECVFIEKAAVSYWMPDGVTPSPNGYGQSSKWNIYIRFARGCTGVEGGGAIGQTVKALRLVE